MKHSEHLVDLTNLGDDISDTRFTNAAHLFILLLYGMEINQTTMTATPNDLRQIFCKLATNRGCFPSAHLEMQSSAPNLDE